MPQTVIIPAHNEAAVLHKTLVGLLHGLHPDVDVTVVCNGCTDETPTIARAFEPNVRVLETPVASKTDALNFAEQHLAVGPRLVVDADVQISGSSVNGLFRTVGEPGVVAAEPRVSFDTGQSSVMVRAWYAVWTALHGSETGGIGAGAYCLSADGRARFDRFPDVISDDGYVRLFFAPGEIARPTASDVTVRAPANLRTLVAIKTRSRVGNIELAERFPELSGRYRERRTPLHRKIRVLPLSVWPLVPLYGAVLAVVRLRARHVDVEQLTWARDDTSR